MHVCQISSVCSHGIWSLWCTNVTTTANQGMVNGQYQLQYQFEQTWNNLWLVTRPKIIWQSICTTISWIAISWNWGDYVYKMRSTIKPWISWPYVKHTRGSRHIVDYTCSPHHKHRLRDTDNVFGHHVLLLALRRYSQLGQYPTFVTGFDAKRRTIFLTSIHNAIGQYCWR